MTPMVNVDNQTVVPAPNALSVDTAAPTAMDANQEPSQLPKAANVVDVLPGRLVGGEIEVTENKNRIRRFSTALA